ncbi:MAG: DinB family protein [Bryobacterales bacterium]|nr:DinB family protein [Bryobacterales bacterium]
MKFALYAAVVTFAATLSAQNPLTTETKTLHDGVRNNILRAAEKMPEEEYAFKPTPDVRSFAQLIGHIADTQYLFCAPVKEEKKGPPGIEKSKTAKADLVAALKEAFDYCDTAYAAMDDAKVVAPIKFFGRERSKLAVLNFNSSHNNEHYGNIVTYMRLKSLVPPSSERR